MRILSLTVLALMASTACNGGNAEVCDDSLDNDENGLIDCADSACADAANCGTDNGTGTGTGTTGTDADGDGFSPPTDCNDNDAAINPDADETGGLCGDGIDEDCDGLDNCIEAWKFTGSATVDATAGTYVGTTSMLDIEAIKPEVIFCTMVYPVLTAATVDSGCTDCAFSFDITHDNYSSKTGDLCDTWYDASWDKGPDMSVGYNASYAFDTGAAPAIMMGFTDTADVVTWYGMSSDVAFDGSAFTWGATFGYYYVYSAGY